MESCLPYISKITNSAVVVLKFPLGLEKFNSSLYANITNALRAELVISKDLDGNERRINSTLVKWNITSISNDSMNLQLVINNPIEISQNMVRLIMNDF